MKVESNTRATEFASDKKDLFQKLEQEFAKHRDAMTTIVNAAKGESEQVRSGIQGLHDKTAEAFRQIKEQVDHLGNVPATGVGGADARQRYKGYLPTKQMVPKTFDGSEETWRSWQEDVIDY